MKEKLRSITENTSVSLGILVIMGSCLLYLSSISFAEQEDAKDILFLRKQQLEYNKNLQEIRESLAEIRGELKHRR